MIKPYAAMDRWDKLLAEHKFLFKTSTPLVRWSSVKNVAVQIAEEHREYVREKRGFLQRLIVQSSGSSGGVPEVSTMTTKCTPSHRGYTLFDVQRDNESGPEGITLLLALADAQLEQFETSGGSSFFPEALLV